MEPIAMLVVLVLGVAWVAYRLENFIDPSSASAVWVDKHGERHTVGSLSRNHMVNILSMLIREGKPTHVWYKNMDGKLRRYHVHNCPVLNAERKRLADAACDYHIEAGQLLRERLKLKEKPAKKVVKRKRK